MGDSGGGGGGSGSGGGKGRVQDIGVAAKGASCEARNGNSDSGGLMYFGNFDGVCARLAAARAFERLILLGLRILVLLCVHLAVRMEANVARDVAREWGGVSGDLSALQLVPYSDVGDGADARGVDSGLGGECGGFHGGEYRVWSEFAGRSGGRGLMVVVVVVLWGSRLGRVVSGRGGGRGGGRRCCCGRDAGKARGGGWEWACWRRARAKHLGFWLGRRAR